MALNFPNTPTNGQGYVDPNGHTWVYETATNSWTAQGAPIAGMVYRGAIDVTAAPPVGVVAGYIFTVTKGGAVNAGFTGLTGNLAVKSQVIFDGTNWQHFSVATPDATEGIKGIVELATAAETTTGTDSTRAVHPAGLKVELDKKAPLASPAFTGTPTAPTAAAGTNTTQIASTAFVYAATRGITGKNIIINGDMRINQRGLSINSISSGQYGPDRWKKVNASNMTQIIEDVNYVHGAKYTLSWKGGTPQVLTAPSTGHWTLPNIPITATEIQLELGEVATSFEHRPYGLEFSLCRRYYASTNAATGSPCYWNGNSVVTCFYSVAGLRAAPTVRNASRTMQVHWYAVNATPPSIQINQAGTITTFLAEEGLYAIFSWPTLGTAGLTGTCVWGKLEFDAEL